MPSLVEIHTILGRTFMFYALAMGLWAMASYLRQQPLDSSYWGAIVIGEVVAIAQGILGIVRFAGGSQPARPLHILYGALAVLMWPALFGYVRERQGTRYESLTLGLGSLFLFGLSVRALTTG